MSPKNIRLVQLVDGDIEKPLPAGEPIKLTVNQLNTVQCKVDVDGDHTGLTTSVFMGQKEITTWFEQDHLE